MSEMIDFNDELSDLVTHQQGFSNLDEADLAFKQPSSLRTDYPIMPDKLYFSISEAAELCLVQPHVLRYWEKQFTTLSPCKKKGRRYFSCQDIFAARQIRELLYVENFTIEGAKSQLQVQSEAKTINQAHYDLIKSTIVKLNEVLDLLKVTKD